MSETKTEIVKAQNPVRTIIGWIIDGQTEADIAEAIAQQWPNAKPGPLILAALREVEKSGQPNRDLIMGWAIEATREIYRKSKEVGDHQTALRAIKQLTELARK